MVCAVQGVVMCWRLESREVLAGKALWAQAWSWRGTSGVGPWQQSLLDEGWRLVRQWRSGGVLLCPVLLGGGTFPR